MRLRSQITTRASRAGAALEKNALARGRRLPRQRPPTHPGEMLLEEFLKPLGITQSELATHLGVSFPRLNEIVRGRRGVTPDTALRLARVLGMPADFWLGLQLDWDLWHALHGKNAGEIERLEPVHRNG
jgi:antitoxin HigA-1